MINWRVGMTPTVLSTSQPCVRIQRYCLMGTSGQMVSDFGGFESSGGETDGISDNYGSG